MQTILVVPCLANTSMVRCGLTGWDVQCDETKPCCRKCDAYGVTCDYTTTARHSSYQSSCEGVAAIESTVHSLSISDLVVRINDALQMGGNTGTVAPLNVNSNAIVALRQFFHFTHDFGRIPDSHRRIMRGSIMRLALQVCRFCP